MRPPKTPTLILPQEYEEKRKEELATRAERHNALVNEIFPKLMQIEHPADTFVMMMSLLCGVIKVQIGDDAEAQQGYLFKLFDAVMGKLEQDRQTASAGRPAVPPTAH